MEFVEEFGEPRPVKADLAPPLVELEPQTRLDEREDGGACPGLGDATDRIEGRCVKPTPREAAKQFGQPPQLHVGGRLEQSLEDLEYFRLQAVAGKAQRNYGIVMRPDRTVVIGHRVIPRRGDRGRADPPA